VAVVFRLRQDHSLCRILCLPVGLDHAYIHCYCTSSLLIYSFSLFKAILRTSYYFPYSHPHLYSPLDHHDQSLYNALHTYASMAVWYWGVDNGPS